MRDIADQIPYEDIVQMKTVHTILIEFCDYVYKREGVLNAAKRDNLETATVDAPRNPDGYSKITFKKLQEAVKRGDSFKFPLLYKDDGSLERAVANGRKIMSDLSILTDINLIDAEKKILGIMDNITKRYK